MAEPILTKFGVKHHWVEGFRFVHMEGLGHHKGGKKAGKFANIKQCSSCELQMTEL